MRLELPFFNRRRRGSGEPALTDESAILVQPYSGGKRYEQAKDGRIFNGSIAAAGVVLPIYSNTAQKFGLWNPLDSGVNVELIQLTLTYVDTTGAAGGFVLAQSSHPGAGVATAAPVSAITEDTPTNGLVGLGRKSLVRFTGTAATVLAPTVYRHLGLNQLVLTAADATNAQWLAKVDFDGDVIVPPGQAIWIAGNIATLIKVAGSLVWAEEPLG